MNVTLMHHTPFPVCSHAVRTCWQSFGRGDAGGPKDRELVDRVGNKLKHASTLEHLVYTFYIQDISRALLQELARHRIASLSVKSTRYTLKELKDEPLQRSYDVASKYCVMTGEHYVDHATMDALYNLQAVLHRDIPNDIAKYCLPEAFKTELTWTINARSLQNFLKLRTSPAALWEMRNLAYGIAAAVPSDQQYLFQHCIYKQGE